MRIIHGIKNPDFGLDPEAACITLRAHWPRIDLIIFIILPQTGFTKEMLAEIARSPNAAVKYLVAYTGEFDYRWDESAAAAWLDPAIITKEEKLYLDANGYRGPFYGHTLWWTAANKPALDVQLVHVQTDLDLPRFNKLFIDL